MDQSVPDDAAPYFVNYSNAEGIRGWIESKLKGNALYGAGKIQVQADGLLLFGWQRTWLGAAVRSEIYIGVSELGHASCEGLRVVLQYQSKRGNVRIVRFAAESAEQAATIVHRIRAARPEKQDRAWVELSDFKRQLATVTPRVLVTYSLIAANVIAYVAVAQSGGNAFWIDPMVLVRWGSNLGLLTLHGEWWRLLTASFLHASWLHLVLNMWALWGVGRLVERLYGNSIFLALYLLTAILSFALSVAWQPETNAVGASGAIFGIVGALIAFCVRRDTDVPASVLRAHLISTGLFALYNIGVGLRTPNIDNAAHIGGLIAGFALGSLFARPLSATARGSFLAVRVAAAVALTSVVTLTVFWTLGGFSAAQAASQRYWLTHKWYAPEEAENLRTLSAIQASANQLSDVEFEGRLKEEIAPFWKRARQRLKAERPASDPELRRFSAAVLEFVELRERWIDAAIRGIGDRDEKQLSQAQRLYADGENARARLERLELLDEANARHRSLAHSYLLRRARGLFKSAYVCVGGIGAQLRSKDVKRNPSDGPSIAAKVGCDAQESLERSDIPALEKAFERYSATLHDLPDGSSSLNGFLMGLSDYFDSSGKMEEAAATLADWRRLYPASIAPDLFQAELFRSWAWQARGDGYAKTVSPQAWQAFGHRLEMAAVSIQESEKRAANHPLWYYLAVSSGMERSIPREKVRATYDRGVEKFPEYSPLYRAMLRSLMPRWHGSYEQIDALINDAYLHTQKQLGFEMYTRLYWTLAALEGDEFNLLVESKAEYSPLKRGFRDMLKHYPHSAFLQNGYARFACEAKDWEGYREARPNIEGHVWETAWRTGYSVEICDKRLKELQAQSD